MKNWQVSLLLSGVIIAVFWPILGQDKAITNDFTLYHIYPLASFVGGFFNDRGILPSWLPGYLSGFPYYLGQYLPVSHFLLFSKFFSFLTAFNLAIFAGFLGGCLVMYLLARNLGFSRPASITAALIYTFGQLNMWLGSILVFNIFLFILPSLFLLTLKLSRGWRPVIGFWAGALIVALSWYSVFSEFLVYSLIAVILFAVWLDFWERKEIKKFWPRFRTTRLVTLFVLVGTLAGSLKILPTLDFIQHSVRAKGALGSTAFFGLGDFVTQFFPYFSLPYANFVSFLSNNFNLYIGVMTLVLAAIFLVGFREIVSGNKTAGYFLLAFLFPFLMLFESSQLYWLMRKVTFGISGGAWKAMFLGNFSIAILAGYALDHIHKIREKKPFQIMVRCLGYLSLVFVTAVFLLKSILFFYRSQLLNLTMGYFEKNIYPGLSAKPLDYYRGPIESFLNALTFNFSFTNYHFLVSFIFALLPFLVIYFYHRNLINLERFKASVVAVVALNAVLIWQGFYQLAPKEAIAVSPRTADFIRQAAGDFRVFRFWPGLSAYHDLGLDLDDSISKLELNRELLTPNLNIIYGISAVDGDENFMSSRQSIISAAIGSFRSPQNEDKNWIKSQLLLPAKLSRFQSPQNRRLLSMMNVRYLLTSFEFNPPLKRVFETKITKANIPVYVYENPEVLPRVYFANNVKFVESSDESAFNELLTISDFRKTALIECLKPECLYALNRPSPSDSLEIIEIKSGYLKLKTSTQYPRWLIYSESNLPQWEVRSWKLEVGNSRTYQPLPIYTANYLYQAVYMPPGENEVVFEYPGIGKQMLYSLASIIGF